MMVPPTRTPKSISHPLPMPCIEFANFRFEYFQILTSHQL